MVYIAYFSELNLQICDYEQKRRICRENSKYALDKNLYGNFCARRKAANFCHTGQYAQNYILMTSSPLELKKYTGNAPVTAFTVISNLENVSYVGVTV